jgi:hypothetical protein
LIGRLASLHDVNRVSFSTPSHLAFKRNCSILCAADGDDALAADNYDRAIELSSAAIDLGLATDTLFVNRSKARSGNMLWDDALLDAEKVP